MGRNSGSQAGRIRSVLAKVRGRPDTEHEIAFNRLAISFIVIVYLGVVHSRAALEALVVMGVYVAIGLAIYAHILWSPARNKVRGIVALAVDLLHLSYQVHLGDEVTAVLYPFYLWVIFGYGFRLGVRFLLAGTAIGLVGFIAMVLTTRFWFTHPYLASGLGGGLVILPLYTSRLIRKLSAATRAAEEASKAKSLFLASVSHELRTPLNAIIGMGGLLMDTDMTAEQADMAATSQGAAKSLLSLIDGILDFSRIEAGQMPTHRVDFELLPLLRDATGMVTAQARAKDLRLALHVTPRTPLLLSGDRRHLQDILINLMGNAVKFTEAGSVTLAADAQVQADGRVMLRLEVTDTGIGIAPESLGHIFDSFTQADDSIINRFGGTGLGLAICKRLATLMGGEIGVESRPGQGSTFWLTAMMELQPGAAMGAAINAAIGGMVPFALAVAQGPDEMDVPPFAGAEAVVLCAAPAVNERLLPMLQAMGMETVPVAAAGPAIALLREGNPTRRRVLVLDEDSQATAAVTLARSIQALESGGDTPILLIAGAGEDGVRTDAAWQLPGAEARLCFSSVLPADASPGCWQAALRIAGADRPLREGLHATPAATDAQVRRLRILVADDNRTNQRVAAKILERAGHEVVVVSNGEEALDALEEPGFDAVLMDVNMPVMSGLEATKMYRFMALGQPHLPILALTADATQDATDKCLAAGMDACLTKPVEPTELLETIYRLVPNVAAASEAEAAVPVPQPDAGPTAVTDITSHPRFRAAEPPAVDPAMLADLEALGGKTFVTELVEEFLTDADVLMDELQTTVDEGDAREFRSKVHALRSAAANVGARGLYEMCLAWREIGRRELAEQGAQHVHRMTAELDRVRAALPRTPPGGGAADRSV